jgi:hypothetical protein
VRSHGALWTLANFTEVLERWIERDEPIPGVVVVVGEWIMSRSDDPYQGVRREAGFDNLWWATVPNSEHQETAVYCAYWIKEADRLVQCESIATLSLPIA